MRFSQRIGKVPLTKEIQLESMDEELLNGLWNMIKLYVLDHFAKNNILSDEGSEYKEFSKILWSKFFKLPFDIIPRSDLETEKIIRDRFFNSSWFEVYDFIEFLMSLETVYNDAYFINGINEVLEKEFSGYRLMNGFIVPIANTLEFEEVQEALEQSVYFTSLNGANIHLSAALEKLSNREYPDYRNSIKESISAIESTCRMLTGESTLGKALKSLELKGVSIDDQLRNGFEKIYAYTNNKQSGIRHAIIEDHKDPDFDDAKYMLVVCSSFINYLIGKSKTQGLSSD